MSLVDSLHEPNPKRINPFDPIGWFTKGPPLLYFGNDHFGGVVVTLVWVAATDTVSIRSTVPLPGTFKVPVSPPATMLRILGPSNIPDQDTGLYKPAEPKADNTP